jgi:hypothetical protein
VLKRPMLRRRMGVAWRKRDIVCSAMLQDLGKLEESPRNFEREKG